MVFFNGFKWAIKFIHADHKCAQHMRPQAMGSNPLSLSRICLYVCPSVRLRAFCDFISVCLVIQGPF